jgi:hypothetical protein
MMLFHANPATRMNNFIRQEIFFFAPAQGLASADATTLPDLQLISVICLYCRINIYCIPSINFRVAKSNRGVARLVFLFRFVGVMKLDWAMATGRQIKGYPVE